jgi:hypothetical protein
MFNSFISDTEPGEYNDYGPKPTVLLDIKNITIGPVAISDATKNLNNKYWATYWDGGTDGIYLDDLSGNVSLIITEPVTVKRVALAFDQNANDTIAWVTENDDLKLRFFNGALPGYVVLNIGDAQDVTLTMDMKYHPSSPTSDILMFYIRDNAIYYRVQRDLYAIEYSTPVTSGASRLIDSGMRKDYRFQVKWF